MMPLHVFFIVAILGVGLGWFGLGSVEWGAVLLGAVIVAFAAEGAHHAASAQRSSAWWAASLVFGACIAIAGAFDLFDVGRGMLLGDWDTGLVIGLVVLVPIALLHVWISRPKGRTSDDERAGLLALVLGVVVTEAIAYFLVGGRSSASHIGDAFIATALGFGASVLAQVRAGNTLAGPRMIGDLAAAALIAVGLVFPTGSLLVPIVLFGTAWGVAMLGVTRSRPERIPGAAFDVFKRSAAMGTLCAALLCVLTLGAFAPRADLSVANSVAALEHLLPLPQPVFARLVMSDRYLWADAPAGAGSWRSRDPQDVIEARRHAGDRWSSARPATVSRAIARGATSRGVDYVYEDGVTMVGHVHPESPAAAAGVRRGWRLANIGWEWETSSRLSFTEPDGTPRDVQLPGWGGGYVPGSWWIVVEHAGRKVGYLYLSSFHRPRLDELSASFSALKHEPVDDLVLDLRYNPGGLLDAAERLASLIAGPALEGKVFQRVIHNERYRDQDSTSRFRRHAEALGLKRVFVLTTRDTCSASEALIKGLAPHIAVVTIGGTTCGKPVGSSALDYWGVSYKVIDFRLRNAAGEGYYFDGLAPTCRATDDLRQSLGAPDEALFAEALHYMSTGECSES